MLEDSATFGKYGVISQKRRKIDIKSLWMTCRKSYTVYWMYTFCSQRMTSCPQMGRGQGHVSVVTYSNFGKMWQYLKNGAR